METQLLVLSEVDSTQDAARDLALRGEPAGLAVMALNQTLGRGSAGRQWISPPGKNLALSLLLRPRISAQDAPLLGMLTSIAAAETVEEHGVACAKLKWPNDVIVDGLKIAGVIAEARLNGRDLKFVIVGVGLNVNAAADDFPRELRGTATSLLMAAGKQADIKDIAQTFLARFGRLFDRVERDGISFIPRVWESRWAHRGSMLTRGEIHGVAEAIDQDGALILRTAEGNLVRVISGDAVPVGTAR
jgi:BirA family biotin operon repressor/biotin-[acetyl-CoA-carboxylase] ligase